jgi:hypothetical protein
MLRAETVDELFQIIEEIRAMLQTENGRTLPQPLHKGGE